RDGGLGGAMLVCVVALVGLTVHRVVATGRRIAHTARDIAALAEFTGAVGRELAAGARAVDAADLALGTGRARRRREVLDRLQVLVREVALGARPADLAGGGEGCDDVRTVMRLWAVSERHGVALGRLMDRFGDDLASRLVRAGHMRSALAGARMTEVILLALPCGAVGLGQATGAGSAVFLVGGVGGNAVLLAGTVLACVGVLWADALTVGALGGVGRRAGPGDARAAVVLDVVAEGTAAGLTTAAAWAAGASIYGDGGSDGGDGRSGGDGRARGRGLALRPGRVFGRGLGREHGRRGQRVGDGETLRLVAGLLALGAPGDAWDLLDGHPAFGPGARQMVRQSTSGARVVEVLRAEAARIRRETEDASRAAGERVLVAVAAPLTLCFLPAFVLVGLVPLVAGLAGR
ncbi:type II secretion system F family protein, partial [Corynebacterium bovis]|uniref:type II secretion system F family protein n=1 Tax=Corynebacterium bovis TaxID=36808 RepID=UPI00280AC1E3